MCAYLIVHVAEVLDEEAYARYRRRAPSALEGAGGRYLARGGASTVLEGGWRPNRLVVVEFADAAAARRWWESEEYAELKALRGGATRTEMVLVEGVGAEGGA